MFYVYLLQDENLKTYVGYSSNLRRRLKEHQAEKVYTTRRLLKPKLIYYEAYEFEEMAKLRERKLKKYGSSYRGLLKRINLRP